MIVNSGFLRDLDDHEHSAAIDADWDGLKAMPNARIVAKLRDIQSEAMRPGGSQALLRVRLNAISDVCAQIIRELGQ